MIYLNSHNTLRALTIPSQGPSLPLSPSNISKNIEVAHSDAIDFSAVPSAIQPLMAPSQVKACRERIAAAKKIGDQEGANDADFKLRQVPFTCIGSLSASITLLKSWDSFKHLLWVNIALKISFVFGMICAAIESVYESFWIYRLQRFLNKPEMQILDKLQTERSLNELEKLFIQHKEHFYSHLSEEEISFAEYYCTQPLRFYGDCDSDVAEQGRGTLQALALRSLRTQYFTEKGIANRVKLERRIRPWCYNDVQNQLDTTLALLESHKSSEVHLGIKKAKDIFQLMEAQLLKKRLLHILGLIGAIVSVALLILTTVALPWAAPIVGLFLFYGLSTFQYIAYAGTLDNPGWKFTPSSCIPPQVKEAVAKIKQRERPVYNLCRPNHNVTMCVVKGTV